MNRNANSMFKRSWADYEDDEDLPPIPWNLVPVKSVQKVKPVKPVKPANNNFWLLELENNSDSNSDED